MAFTTSLPWNKEEVQIKNFTQENKKNYQRLLDAIAAFEADEELRAVLQIQNHSLFVKEAKNLALEVHRYKRMLATQALKTTVPSNSSDALNYLSTVIYDTTKVIRQVAATVKDPTEAKQAILKDNLEALHKSTENLAKVSGTEAKNMFGSMALLYGCITAVFAIALANPILGIISAANFLMALCTGNSTDDQFYKVEKAKDSFARAGTNLFNQRKPTARATAQPKPEETKQDPGYMGYPRLNP